MACTMAMACGLLTTGPRLAPHRSSVVFMTAAGGDASEQQGVEAKSVARVELLAQRNEDRSAVGSISPGGGRAEQQQYVGVPPPGSGVQPAAPATMISRVRAPFIGLTLTACVAIAGWQSKRVYKERQQGLLEEFGATMAAYLGEEREMASTLKLFRGQLGPGSHTVPMFVAFLKQMAMDRPADIATILDLKRAVVLMQMTPASLIEALPLAMDGLQSQPCRSTVKVPKELGRARQRLRSAPARLLCLLRARLAALAGSALPGEKPARWAPSHCLGCSS